MAIVPSIADHKAQSVMTLGLLETLLYHVTANPSVRLSENQRVDWAGTIDDMHTMTQKIYGVDIPRTSFHHEQVRNATAVDDPRGHKFMPKRTNP